MIVHLEGCPNYLPTQECACDDCGKYMAGIEQAPFANINYHDGEGRSVLHIAAQYDVTGKIFGLLLNLSPKLAMHCDNQARSVLHYAVESGNTIAYQMLLLQHPGIVFVRDSTNGDTALHVAVQSNNHLATRLLSPFIHHVTDHWGLTAIHRLDVRNCGSKGSSRRRLLDILSALTESAGPLSALLARDTNRPLASRKKGARRSILRELRENKSNKDYQWLLLQLGQMKEKENGYAIAASP